MPGPHPDDDMLADLAADVLPVERARAVEAHVLQCDRCAELLADAERVRGLLLADDPGPVPPEVWHRIEGALAAETRPQEAAHKVSAPMVPLAGPPETGVEWDGPDPLDDPEHWNGHRRPAIRPSPDAADHPEGAADARAGGTPVTGSLRGLTASRRDARGDGRRALPWPTLLAAAAAVALVAVVGSVRLAQGGGNQPTGTAALSSGTASDASGSAAFAGSGAAHVVSSGRNYTTQGLAAQVRPLISAVTSARAGTTRSSQADAAPDSAAPGAAPGASPVPAPAANAEAVAPDPRATDIRSPQRLAACLAALNASGESLVAVDLARFQNREAAVLVLRAAGGGYEVFVVERTCAPGDEGTLGYARLPG